jgi:hypothetical protein
MLPVRSGLTAGICLVLAAAGCGKTPPPIVPVSGIVVLNGQPLPHAEVRFCPMFTGLGSEYIATGVTDDQGRFHLTCPIRDGAAACENKVTVTDGPMPEGARGMSAAAQTKASAFLAGLKNRPIPPSYSNVAKTPLTVTVDPKTAEYKIELVR